ncbi:MAG: hypothetical protein JWQ71_1754 [Pedosphaera sp.]|nr:hypothetical protein [Pedosphaera sp.]
MDEVSIIQYITDTFVGIEMVKADGNVFFFHGPARMLPMVTLVSKDDYDNVSNLNRPGVFRLNIGISKPTFLSLFGSQPAPPGVSGVIDTGHDFTALDKLMPHPVYGQMFWVCVLNPGAATWETVQTLLAEAYNTAVSKHTKPRPAE